ncbi:hypothetical protein ABZ832_06770 [Streptantibioticus parmotrematis]
MDRIEHLLALVARSGRQMTQPQAANWLFGWRSPGRGRRYVPGSKAS